MAEARRMLGPQVTRAGYWGSSQGGWVAPLAATKVEPDFLVVRVGPGVSELEAHVHETRQEARQEGLAGLALDHASSLSREIYGLAVAGEPLSATDALVTPYLDQSWYQTAFGAGLVSGRWSQRWWRWAQANMAVEPGPSLRQLDLPILWFLAENDENVPLVASRAALERGEHRWRKACAVPARPRPGCARTMRRGNALATS